MKNRFALLLFPIALAAASAVFAQDAAPAPTEPAKSEQKLICKKEKSIGSQMVKRVCRTQAQVDAEREAARKGLETGAARCERAECRGG